MTKAYMILDLQFGSTGKGLLAGYLAKTKQPDVVVTAWGPNAGHTYIDEDGREYIHRMLANGIVSPKLKTVLIGPGSVLVIDDEVIGGLALSREAYDSRVAGIVAGGKGLGSAVRIGAAGFDCDVALAGRVYCNVDASYGAVKPGDLLTTSSTPGYAMRVADREPV